MTLPKDTLDWLLKAALWISANESLEDSLEALREAKNEIRSREDTVLSTERHNREVIYRLLESVVWTASGKYLDGVASNLIEIFDSFRPSDFELNGEAKHFGDTLLECDVHPADEMSEFWNYRIDSAQERGAAAAEHTLLDYALKTVEVGVHPIKPDPVSFIIDSFSEDEAPGNPDIEFPIKVQHRSAQVSIRSDQFESIHDKVVWIDDSSGRMGVVGGEPLPVIGQAEGYEPALRLDSDGEQSLQPFDQIELCDGDDYLNA